MRRGVASPSGAEPDYSVATLHDLPGLGMTVNLHAAAAHGIDLATRTPEPHRLVCGHERPRPSRSFERKGL